VQYKTCVRGSFTREDHEVEEVGLFDEVGIIMEEGKKLTWYLGCVKNIKHLDKGGHADYVRLVQLNEEGIKILPNITNRLKVLVTHIVVIVHEADFVNFSYVICLIALTRDA
jgi:hypothetical protein